MKLFAIVPEIDGRVKGGNRLSWSVVENTDEHR